MYYDGFMNYLVSVSSRGLIYIPKEAQKKAKIKKPGKVELIMDGNEIRIKAVKDIMDFAGIGKKYAKFEYWKNFRDRMEKEYEDVS